MSWMTKFLSAAPSSGDTARGTSGRRIYAIGDVHGRVDLLDDLLSRIRADAADSAAYDGAPVLVTLGDYVDRGPDSAGVLDRLVALQDAGFEARFLMGNHEEAMIEFLYDPGVGPRWAAYGGVETLVSYDVTPPDDDDLDAWSAARDAFATALPPSHRALLEERLELCAVYGDYMFVHAGVRPGRPLDSQVSRDLLWIRGDFLDDSRRLARMIVHGHTPHERPYMDDRRVGLDCGAYITGMLAAARIQDGAVAFLHT